MRSLFLIALLAIPAWAAPPTTCREADPYSRALCAYQRRNFDEAAAGFRELAGRTPQDAQTIRALYFLARTEMKRGRFEQAAPIFIRIYSLDPAFYSAWSCDHLLGECRRAVGRD